MNKNVIKIALKHKRIDPKTQAKIEKFELQAWNLYLELPVSISPSCLINFIKLHKSHKFHSKCFVKPNLKRLKTIFVMIMN